MPSRSPPGQGSAPVSLPVAASRSVPTPRPVRASRSLRWLVAATLGSALAMIGPVATAADCELAILKAQVAADYGRAAAATESVIESTNLASNARIPAIDAARGAKACGCPDAVPFLAEVALAAERSSLTQFLASARQYGDDISKNGNLAVSTLKKCAAQ